MGVRLRPDLTSDRARRLAAAEAARPGAFQRFAENIPLGAAQLGDAAVDLFGAGLSQIPGLEGVGGAVAGAPTLTGQTREGLTSLLGRAPEESGLAAAAGRGVGEAIPTLPLTAGLGAARLLSRAGRAGIELASGAAGETARTGAEAVGFGTGGQIAASIAGGLSPSAVVSSTRRLAIRGGQLVGPLRTKRAMRLARNVLGESIANQSRAVEALREEATRPLFGLRATTSQALPFEPRVGVLEKSASRSANDLGAQILEMRLENARAAVRNLDELFPGVSTGRGNVISSAFDERAKKFGRDVDNAYKGLKNIKGIPSRKVVASAALIVEDAGEELQKFLPSDVLKIVSGYGDTVSLDKLRRLRRLVAADIRGMARDPEKATTVFYLNRIADALESTFDDVARMGGAEDIAAFNRARRLAAEEKALFGRKLETTKAFASDGFDDPSRAIGRLLNTKNPSGEMSRLKNILSPDPDAVRGLERLMAEAVFGPRGFASLVDEGSEILVPGAINRALGNLGRHKRAFNAVFGEGASKDADRFLKRLRRVSRGVAGTPAEAAVSGSNVPDLSSLFGGEAVSALILSDVATGRLGRAAFRVAISMGRDPIISQTRGEATRILARAMVDTAFARILLERFTPQEFSVWQRTFATPSASITRGFVAPPEERGRE